MKNELSQLIDEYRSLSAGVVNVDLFDQMVHTHHSTALEGSSLTLAETQTLLEKGLTALGKPLVDHLMVVDHQKALQYVLTVAANKTPLSSALLQEIAGLVMAGTGTPVNTILGTYDIAKGDFRKGGVSAGSRVFMDAAKVPRQVARLCDELNQAIGEVNEPEDVYALSFLAHYQLVTIHPFGDGNGRTSRLLMNYVQHVHGLPLSLVNVQDRTAYIAALESSRQQENTVPILTFMMNQLITFLNEEISRLKPVQKQIKGHKGGLSLLF